MPTLDELFAMMPNAFDASKAKDFNATSPVKAGTNILFKLPTAKLKRKKERPIPQLQLSTWTPTTIKR